MKRFLLIGLVLIALVLSTTSALAQQPVVHAVMFYSPTCGHCEYVMMGTLAPLVEQYEEQLVIIAIDVSSEEGGYLFFNTCHDVGVPEEMIGGVPTLIVGDRYLIGSLDIPEQFPGIVEQGLANGGIPWPNSPELLAALGEQGLLDDTPVQGESNNTENGVGEGIEEAQEKELGVIDLFKQDVLGNSMSVAVLLGLLISVVIVGRRFYQGDQGIELWPDWVMVVLLIIGFIVAGYMSYIELTSTNAVCGPVGDCHTVHQSEYAKLFGIIPIGSFGVFGCVMILVAWLVWKYGRGEWDKYGAYALFAFSAFGVLFSMYLTFLEPFVIGATCAWCLTSALVMMVMLWTALPIVLQYSDQDTGE